MCHFLANNQPAHAGRWAMIRINDRLAEQCIHSPSLSGRPMSHKMVVVNEWTGVARTLTGGPMIISSSLTGWPIGFLISAGNPTPPIFTIPSFAGRPMGLLVCASLAGPSYQVPPSPAGQWLLGLCFAGWPIFVIPSLAGWPMAAFLCFAGWPSSSVPPSPAGR